MRASPRIAIVQFQPKLGQVQANLAKARELCRGIAPRSVDLVCLPEMAFSGYAFESADAIRPFLESAPRPGTGMGPTGAFCAELARRLQCCVFAGYPERLAPGELARASPGPVGANSAVLFGPAGEWLGGYRKTNLYKADLSWAKAGTGFATFALPPPLATVSVGICMDLNAAPPHDWTREDGPYELADYARARHADVLVLLCAWLDSGEHARQKHDVATLNFWAERLRPLWASSATRMAVHEPDSRLGAGVEPCASERAADAVRETLVVVCNRGGAENGNKYAGCSAVFRMRRGGGKAGILRAALGREDEGVLVWDADADVDRDGDGDEDGEESGVESGTSS
ncbi:carbon-nitrogen hydrolase [Mycena pura]|uniref:Carbon-nitrogen hydrolase n=1 Tax=Mycena pura TaxID=153505 RepID=A0AAD6VJI2_9AGAR|nr:carbon-nitrogen hydrolase [Mycena pura]